MKKDRIQTSIFPLGSVGSDCSANSSVTEWLDNLFNSCPFTIMITCQIAFIHIFQSRFSFCQIRNKAIKNCQRLLKLYQSGEILPNLVTLANSDTATCHDILIFFARITFLDICKMIKDQKCKLNIFKLRWSLVKWDGGTYWSNW